MQTDKRQAVPLNPFSNSYGSLAYIEWDSFGATIPGGPRLHYPTFLDPCLTHEWISCCNWVIAPSNLYTTFWMAISGRSLAERFPGTSVHARAMGWNTSRCTRNMAQHAVWNWSVKKKEKQHLSTRRSPPLALQQKQIHIKPRCCIHAHTHVWHDTEVLQHVSPTSLFFIPPSLELLHRPVCFDKTSEDVFQNVLSIPDLKASV